MARRSFDDFSSWESSKRRPRKHSVSAQYSLDDWDDAASSRTRRTPPDGQSGSTDKVHANQDSETEQRPPHDNVDHLVDSPRDPHPSDDTVNSHTVTSARHPESAPSSPSSQSSNETDKSSRGHDPLARTLYNPSHWASSVIDPTPPDADDHIDDVASIILEDEPPGQQAVNRSIRTESSPKPIRKTSTPRRHGLSSMMRRHHAIERTAPIAKSLMEDQLGNDHDDSSNDDKNIIPDQVKDQSPVDDSDAPSILNQVGASTPQDENRFFTDDYNDQPDSTNSASTDQNIAGGFDLSGDNYDTTPAAGGHDALADSGFGGDYDISDGAIGEPDTMSSASLNNPDLNDSDVVDSSTIDPNDYFGDPSDDSSAPSDDQAWSMDDLSEPDDPNNQFVFDADDQPGDDKNSNQNPKHSGTDDGSAPDEDQPSGEDDSDNDQESSGNEDQNVPKWKQGLNSFLRQANAELHGEDADDPDPNASDEDNDGDPDSNGTDKNNGNGNGKNNTGQKNDGGDNGSRNGRRPGGGFHPFKIIGTLLGGIFKLIGITGRLLQSVISIGFILIIAWLVLNVAASLQHGSSSNESIDEGTVAVSDRGYSDGRVTATFRNKSDLIAHVGGSAEVKAWSPDLNPINLVNPRLVATCKIDQVDVNPGESKSVTSEQCHVTARGLWNHMRH